jgi:hypothetical protein
MLSKKILWVAMLLLALLHHDFWFWDDPSLVFGFMPVGLAYHVAYSLVAAGLWAWGVKYAWPSELEDLANQGSGGGPKS